MDNAYHGNTNSMIDLSPYKFKGRGGAGKKEYVHIAEMPDGIRGKWKYSNSTYIFIFCCLVVLHILFLYLHLN